MRKQIVEGEYNFFSKFSSSKIVLKIIDFNMVRNEGLVG